MIVDKNKTIIIDPEHSIEFGKSSWDNSVQSIRRRKNNPTGSYDPISSSEVPIDGGFLDIHDLVCECLKKDLISHTAMSTIFKEIIDSANRQSISISISL